MKYKIEMHYEIIIRVIRSTTLYFANIILEGEIKYYTVQITNCKTKICKGRRKDKQKAFKISEAAIISNFPS